MKKTKVLKILLFLAIIGVAFLIISMNNEVKAAETPSVKVNFINVDEEETFAKDWMEVGNEYSNYSVSLVLVKLSDENRIIGGKNFYIDYSTPEMNLLEKYPDFFEEGYRYAIFVERPYRDFWLNPSLCGYDANYNGDALDLCNEDLIYHYSNGTERPADYSFAYAFTYNDGADFNLNLYWQFMSGRYNVKIHNVIEEDDPDLEPIKTHYYWFRFKNSDYLKLLNEDEEGNRTYVFVPNSIVGDKISADELTKGIIKVDSDKITTIITPGTNGGEFRYASLDEFVPGYIGRSYSSDGSGPGRKSTRNFILAFASKYGIKTFTKTDVNGERVDAQFEIKVRYQNYNFDDVEKKFRFKHFDEKVIKGITYKNVYMVVGTADLDDESDECIINTDNGDFTLYYPFFAEVMSSYNADTYTAYRETAGSYSVKEMYLVEKGADVGYILNPEQELINPNSSQYLQIDYSTEESSGYRSMVMNYLNNITDRVTIADRHFKQSVEIDEETILANFDNYVDDGEHITIVNKRKPIVKSTISSSKQYNGNFTFKVFDKETGELVATLTAKADEEVALEPFVVNDDGIETGYLRNGRTYIVKQEKSDDYDLEDVDGENGEIDDEELSYEFTFDDSLNKIYKAIFNNKIEETEPDPEEKPEEEPKEDQKEEPKDESEEKPEEEKKEETPKQEEKNEEESPQTGDNVIKICAGAIALIVIANIVIIRKRK